MKKQTLTKGLIGVAILGSSALISCTNPKNTNPIKTDSETTTVVNIESTTEPLFSDTTMVMHIGDDTDFAFLIGEGSQPYMTISINFRGGIMAYWGDVEHRVYCMDISMDELKQTILGRFKEGDTPKENELFHVEFDRSTSKDIILALKDMLLEIGVNRCEVPTIHDILNTPIVPPPPKVVTLTEVTNIVEDNAEIEETTIVYSEDQAEFIETSETTKAEEDETEKIHQMAEQQPEFPGGMAELLKYLQGSIKYPADCRKEGIAGRVIVQFVVNKDGSISDAYVVKSVDPRLDAEALRVVNAMPNWIPGKQKGKQVRVRFTLPVTFRLQN